HAPLHMPPLERNSRTMRRAAACLGAAERIAQLFDAAGRRAADLAPGELALDKNRRGGVMKLRIDATNQVPLDRFAHDESGATAIEYSVLAAGIGVAVAGAIRVLGGNVSALYDSIAGIFG